MARQLYRVFCYFLLFALLAGWGCSLGDEAGIEGDGSGSEYVGTNDDEAADEDSGDSAEEDDQGGDTSSGQLTAGEWSDLDNWGFWLELFEEQQDDQDQDQDQQTPVADQWNQFESDWGYYTRDRYGVIVTDGDEPAIDVGVELLDEDQEVLWSARTDNRGRAELFGGLFGASPSGSLTIVAGSGDFQEDVGDVDVDDEGRLSIELDDVSAPDPALDLMFTVDTTGSMGDELSYLQSELEDTIERVRDDVDQDLALRLSVNFYRDEGDDYVVRSYPFTEDIDEALGQLEPENADGGGDFPEAVDQALEDSIDDHDWSQEATARLLFVILDAPPHDDQQSLDRLDGAVANAAEEGVRIIPVVGSGIDKSTEYLMRSLSIATGGTYVFLTDDSGIGGSHLEPTVGDYEVEFLNDLLVRLITEASQQP